MGHFFAKDGAFFRFEGLATLRGRDRQNVKRGENEEVAAGGGGGGGRDSAECRERWKEEGKLRRGKEIKMES